MTVYSLQPYEEGLRSDGFYEVKTAGEVFGLIKDAYRGANHPVTVVLRKHEIESECDICSASSVVDHITLEINFEKSDKRYR